jgi:amino acid transporter
MTYETIEQTINLLCEKLGIVVDSATGVAEQLVPQIVRMELANNIYGVVLGIILTVIGIWGIRKIAKYRNSDDFTYDDDFITILGYCALGMLIIVNGIMLIVDIGDVIDWVVAPDIKAIEYITSLID